ncbi:hypothetical protein [Paracoccus sanguinis]|uniref:hypothetical protein n=1 Tax=Paracoccus sanguinis TaxID=1545044 RepID=UPI000B30B440|nr:hypothetical protein [Paracoccus sanguinis]
MEDCEGAVASLEKRSRDNSDLPVEFMESLLQGRLRNTYLAASKGMIPLYEAVVNSIQAIEDDAAAGAQPIRSHKITVRVIRSLQTSLQLEGKGSARERITGFEVTDDGIGFTEDNWKSFRTLDSLWKAQRGCRGIGRLMWLKAFKQVRVDSVFAEDSELKCRRFRFDVAHDVKPEGDVESASGPKRTVLCLEGFEPRFAEQAPKTARVIAIGLLEHCLWYFVREQGVPEIVVEDGPDRLVLDDLYDEHMHSAAHAEQVEIKGEPFEIMHVKFRAAVNKTHGLNYCAAGRLVKEEAIQGKIPGLAGAVTDDRGQFTYAAYLTSPFLNERVVEQRIGFNIEDEVDGMFAATDISFRDIREAVLPRVKVFLSDALEQNIAAGKERVATFVAKKAPRYRPILAHIPSDELVVDANISDANLDALLHKHLFRVEQNLLSEGHKVLSPGDDETEEAYEKRLDDYLQKVSDLKQSDLANYVTHRRVIIDLLAKAIERDASGRYVREDVIHELIVPMRVTSDDLAFRRQSLWLLDERLAFHDFLASDKPIATMPITESACGKEPDVASLRTFDNPLLVSDKAAGPAASLTVVEIKRPMRSGFKAGQSEEHDPILQALDYLRRLREGAKAKNGRPIPNADKIPGFVYVVADLTDHLRGCCELHHLKITADGMGYFGYHPSAFYNAYIQVISFDGLVASATERNRAFFDRLGLPSS